MITFIYSGYHSEASSRPADNPQALRDEILHRPLSRHSQPDRGSMVNQTTPPSAMTSPVFPLALDLDGSGDEVWGRDWSQSSQPTQDDKHYSSSTTVIITQKPDGVYSHASSFIAYMPCICQPL